jgi:Arc/MetJ-type ribon-helix-helix transcriptional regulator
MTIHRPSALEASIRQKVERGDLLDANAVIREAMRLLDQHERQGRGRPGWPTEARTGRQVGAGAGGHGREPLPVTAGAGRAVVPTGALPGAPTAAQRSPAAMNTRLRPNRRGPLHGTAHIAPFSTRWVA